MKITTFLADLGSEKGAPGGGAAAALTGAMGVALIEMVARLNDKRHKKISGSFREASALKLKLYRFMEEDARAFAKIHKIYPNRKTNKALWQSALAIGASVPLKMAESCVAASKLILAEKKRTSAWLESDLKEASLLLSTAFQAACLNVEINLKEMSDRAFQKSVRGKIKRWQKQLQKY